MRQRIWVPENLGRVPAIQKRDAAIDDFNEGFSKYAAPKMIPSTLSSTVFGTSSSA
jgi:hypothetical protein